MARNKGLVEVGGAYPKITITPLEWTERQQIFIDLVLDDKNKVMFCAAPAGTGKTILSTYCGLKLLTDDKIRKIIYVRNPVESCSGRGLGFIKGKTDEKMDPYIMPLKDNINKLLDSHSSRIVEKLNAFEAIPLGFCKGRTFDDALVIVDEAEDFTYQDLRLILTRLGKRSKMIIIGDEKQSNMKDGKFSLMIKIFNNPEARYKGVQTFTFSAKDIMRNDLIQYLVSEIDKNII